MLTFSSAVSAATVKVHQTDTGWELLVDGKPYVVKGMCYAPSLIGESHHNNTFRDWMLVDDNNNGKNDYAYDTWVDHNRNNIQDEGEEAIGDFQLLKDMGVNTIRLYHHASDDPEIQKLNPGILSISHAPNKEILRELYDNYGIMVMMGDLLGAYTMSAGVEYEAGTDYRDPIQQANMLKSVERMVLDFKDEPYILMWALGNENNLTHLTQNNSKQYPDVYAKFVNKVVKRIHELDPNHPVVLVNGEVLMIDAYAKHTQDLDILGLNSYRNFKGFDTMWKEVKQVYDKPVVLTEYGQGYKIVKDGKLNEDRQAEIHKEAWLDIQDHLKGGKEPQIALGGFAFQWVDKWWDTGDPYVHDSEINGHNPEWCGIASQGNGQHSPYMRQLRPVYYTYQKLWK